MVQFIWKLLNSNLFLTILTLIFGGIVSSYLATRWQKRKELFDLKLKAYHETLKIYHLILSRFHNLDTEKNIEIERIELHSRFKAANKLNRALFEDIEINQDWEYVSQSLANLFVLVREGAKERQINKLKEKIFNKASEGLEKMIKEQL